MSALSLHIKFTNSIYRILPSPVADPGFLEGGWLVRPLRIKSGRNRKFTNPEVFPIKWLYPSHRPKSLFYVLKNAC